MVCHDRCIEVEIEEARPENCNRRKFSALGHLSFFTRILPSFGCGLLGFFLILIIFCHLVTRLFYDMTVKKFTLCSHEPQ
jgi:hypothetical protein